MSDELDIDRIERRIDHLKHANAMAADQIHFEMDPTTETLIHADIAGNEAAIDHLETVLGGDDDA